jgi:hypothetical protein
MATAGKITVQEGDAPATPTSGYVEIYAKSDGRTYGKDDAGTEFAMFGAGRRAVIGSRGTASDYPGEWFVENRQSGSTPDRGDQVWISLQKDDASWEWTFFGGAT